MGCGDARLASSLKNTTYSFDLVSVNDKVTACDMAHVPLPDAAVDIVVFCLSLMGTNIGDFLRESHRILKSTGILKIAEVRSRFEGEENGFKKFTSVLKQAGFDIRTKDSSNKMFFFVECVKTTRQPDIDPSYSLLPCIYKRR
jgi:ribosomal RNA-processing protein 8